MRPYRAFTEDELRRLFAVVSPERRIVYLTLLYTGQRRGEIAALVIDDLALGDGACVRVRVETTKDKDKRAVPLHPLLAAELRRFIPENASPADLVFQEIPTYDALLADLHWARIERRDAMGRSLHFHSFRKTWQTMGVRAGISQRVAQDILGHSDPALTANVYTDVPAIGTQEEIAKLPWIFDALRHSPKEAKTTAFEQFRQMLGQLVVLAKVVAPECAKGKSPTVSAAAHWLPGLDSNQD